MTKEVKTSIHEVHQVTKSVSLSSGGFVELQLDEAGNGYLKIHVSKNTSVFIPGDAWRWIQRSDDKQNIKLLTEIRDAANALLESIE